MGQFISILLISSFGLLIISIVILQIFPARWTVEGKLNIRSMPPFVFNQINLVEQWPAWHVWMQDAKFQRTSEQEIGLGARLRWKTPELAGELTLVQSDPTNQVQVHFMMVPRFEMLLILSLDQQSDNSTDLSWQLISKSDALNPLRKLQIAALKSAFKSQTAESLKRLADRMESLAV